MTTLLTYDLENPTVKSPQEEWRPRIHHMITIEWWYMTTVMYGEPGHPYFIVWGIFNLSGSAYHPPEMWVRQGRSLVTVLGGLIAPSMVDIGELRRLMSTRLVIGRI